MTKEELKALGLTDEQIEKVVEDYGKNYVAKSQFNQKNEEAKALKAEIETARKETEGLKKANADNAELVKQLDDLKAAGKKRDEEYEGKIKQMQIDAIVERTLVGAKAKNIAAVKALLDLQDPKTDGDSVKGLDEQIASIKQTDGYLFESEEPVIKGVTPAQETGGENGIGAEQQFMQALGL